MVATWKMLCQPLECLYSPWLPCRGDGVFLGDGPVNLIQCKFAGISNLRGDGIGGNEYKDRKHMLTAIKIELKFHC